MWSVEFTDRNNFRVLTQLRFAPERFACAAMGGPVWAEINVSGDAMELLQLLGWLRYAVLIRNPMGEPVWWGYVDGVVVQGDAVSYEVALEAMANRVAVAYSFVAPGSQTVGTRETTGWQQNDQSINEYGIKEMLLSVDGATTGQAEQIRDRFLDEHRLPLLVARADGGTKLICAGWWQTLAWRYYANAATNGVETTLQIADILSDVGQFFTGVDVVNASGIVASEYRSGDNTAMDVILQLLRSGTADGAQLWATVTPERRLRILAEPSAQQARLKWEKGFVNQMGNRLSAGMLPVGEWVSQDLPVISAVVGMSPLFLVEAEFDVQQNVITPTWRGASSAWDLRQIVEG
jgi:hypothetical protein